MLETILRDDLETATGGLSDDGKRVAWSAGIGAFVSSIPGYFRGIVTAPTAYGVPMNAANPRAELAAGNIVTGVAAGPVFRKAGKYALIGGLVSAAAAHAYNKLRAQ